MEPINSQAASPSYALIWFLVTDRVKLLAYYVLDHINAEAKTSRQPKATPKLAAKAKPDAELEAKPDAGPEPNPGASAEPAPAGRANSDTETAPKPDDVAVARSAPAAKGDSQTKPAPEPQVEPEPKVDVAALFNMKLSDVLLAGSPKTPRASRS